MVIGRVFTCIHMCVTGFIEWFTSIRLVIERTTSTKLYVSKYPIYQTMNESYLFSHGCRCVRGLLS